MWLMTKYVFYSIVQKMPDEYHVRARERKDLENLIAIVLIHDCNIRESSHTDYAVRIILKKAEIFKILVVLGNNIDYDNFKDMIDRTPNQARKPYHTVWQVLADALRAYGQKLKLQC
jgi:hypothetical protein